MTQTQWQVVILTVACVASSLFVLGYGFLAPWYRSQFGRSRITAEASLSLLLGLSLLAYWFGFVLPMWAQTAVFILIALGSCLQLAAFVHEQIQKRRKP